MHRNALLLATAFLIGAATAAPTPTPMPTSEFERDINAAMDRMMAEMRVRPTGDVDRDFAMMMIPHHRGAIGMAVAELHYGSNPQLKRIAQEIIVDQQQEIDAMRLAVGDPLSARRPVPTQPRSSEPLMEH